MSPGDKPLVWLSDRIRTPPFGSAARLQAGFLLRCLQRGLSPSMPHARAMPTLGRRCLELRISDGGRTWRIVCRCDDDAVVIAAIFAKKTRTTPKALLEICRKRFKRYDHD